MKMAQGKSPIYTQEFFAQYKNFLQDMQRLDTFNILFGTNSSGSFGGANGNDLNTNLMSLNLSKIKPLNKVDIKA